MGPRPAFNMSQNKMAAPFRTCLLSNSNRSTGIVLARWYSRNYGRSVRDVRTSEEEVDSLRRRRITDPKRNPLFPFLPDDPVQKNLHDAATRRRKENVFGTRSPPNESKFDRENRESYENVKDELVEDDDHSQTKFLTRRKTKLSQRRDFTFEKLEENDKRFGRLIMQAQSKTGRSEHKEIVLEGKNLIVDALKAGARMKYLYFAGADTMEHFPTSLLGDAEVYKVVYKALKVWSDVATPQGLLGIFELPRTDKPLKPAQNPVPFTLICDSVRDGGNLGSLIRTAAAVGCSKVIVMKGCVDIWNGKVLRAAAGGHYRVPIVSDVTWPQLHRLLPPADDIKVFVADSNQPQPKTASLDAVDRIEKLKEMDLFENSNEKDSDLSDIEDTVQDVAFENIKYKKKANPDTRDVNEDDSYRNMELLNAYKDAPLAVDLYDSVDYTEKHPVVVMSGETSGISLPARKLSYDHFGGIVNIPMESEVDNLNCTVVGSVIMYEIARQFRKKGN